MVRRALIRSLLLIPVAALAAWLVWQQLDSDRPPAAESLLDFSIDRVTSISLSAPQSRVGLRLEQGEWFVRDPVSDHADAEAVKQLLELLGELMIAQRVPSGEPLALYALDPPAYELSLGHDGTQTVLRGGKRNTFNGLMYVQRSASSEVLLVDGALTYQLGRDLWQWRSKAVVRDLPTQPSRVSLSVDGVSTLIEGKDGRWRAGDVEIDPERIAEMLRHLRGLRALGIHQEALQDDAPAPIRIQVDATELGLWPQPDGTFVASAGVGQLAHLVPGSRLLAPLRFDRESWRDRRLLLFERDDVVAVEMMRGEESFRLELRDGDWWVGEQPARRSEVFALLYKLWRLRAQRLGVAQGRIENPSARIVLEGRAGRIGVLEFGDIDADARRVSRAKTKRIDVISMRSYDALDFRASHYVGPD